MDFLKNKNLIFRRTLSFNCSYLPKKMEKRLYINIPKSTDNQNLVSELTKNGFRRSFDHMYIPICDSCNMCIPSRINIKKFKLSKSNKRNLKINQDLIFKLDTGKRNNERYELFKEYCITRHNDSQMAHMNKDEFESFFYNKFNKTNIYDIFDSSNSLIGSILMDVFADGYSAIYSFFEPQFKKRGLGKYLIIKSILELKVQNIPYLYLGFWVKNSTKMDYKVNFNNTELFVNGKWKEKTKFF